MKLSKLLSNILMEGPTPGLENPNTPNMSVQAPEEAKPADTLMPDVSTPNKPFELREAIMRKPSNRPLVKKIANPYPTVSKIMSAVEKIQSPEGEIVLKEHQGDITVSIGGHEYMFIQDARIEDMDVPNIVEWVENTYYDQQPPYEVSHHWGHKWKKKDQQAESQYPAVDKAMKSDLVEEKDNLHRLGIETEEEFGLKFKGKLDQLAEEHDLGDMMGYALLPTHIIIWGSENCMELTYDLEDPMVNPVYYFDVGAAPEEQEEIEEIVVDEESQDA